MVWCSARGSSSFASTSRAGRDRRGALCRERRSPPSSLSSSSLLLSLSSLSLSLPHGDFFLPHHDAPATALLLLPTPPPSSSSSRIRHPGGQQLQLQQEQRRQYRHQHQHQRYRCRQTRASWWCSPLESDVSPAAEIATATQQLLGTEQEEEEKEEVGRLHAPRAVPRLLHNGTSSTKDVNVGCGVEGIEDQLGLVESHGYEPIAGAAATETAAAAAAATPAATTTTAAAAATAAAVEAAAAEAEGASSAIARRRRRQLESSWLEDPGKDVPFEFANMRQVCGVCACACSLRQCTVVSARRRPAPPVSVPMLRPINRE